VKGNTFGSLRFDPADGEWKVRRWGGRDNDDAILIGDDGKVLSEDDDTNYDGLYKFGDFTGDGFDDVALRCLAIDQTTGSLMMRPRFTQSNTDSRR
jgi:hypothetical protein